MASQEKTESEVTYPTLDSLYQSAKRPWKNDESGISISSSEAGHRFTPTVASDSSATSKETGESGLSPKESIEAMDPMVLRRLQSETGALELPALRGTDLASFALTRSHAKLSLSDLNIIGMALLKDAVAQPKPDHKSAASVFSTMANMNSKAPGPKKDGPTDRVRAALERAASAIEAERRRKKTVVDIPAEQEDE